MGVDISIIHVLHCDLFDIKLNPNLLGIKINTEVSKSQAQLDNIKSISEVLIRDINNNSNNFDDISLNKMISDSAGDSFENSRPFIQSLFDNRRYFQHAHFIPIVDVGKRGAY